ncbi:MAG: hypothetical protein R2714_07220 [Microthrixaceae bacterium]
MALLVAALRWSRFGRQLVAMRDSEAACATFGLNLLWPRIGVFAFSAGIAGLGGALYAMQLGSVAPARFSLLNGLPIFIVVVVGGAGLVGSGLFAGSMLFGVLPFTSGWGPVFAKINSMFSGLAGIGLGRHPSGAVPVFSRCEPAAQRSGGAGRDGGFDGGHLCVANRRAVLQLALRRAAGSGWCAGVPSGGPPLRGHERRGGFGSGKRRSDGSP